MATVIKSTGANPTPGTFLHPSRFSKPFGMYPGLSKSQVDQHAMLQGKKSEKFRVVCLALAIYWMTSEGYVAIQPQSHQGDARRNLSVDRNELALSPRTPICSLPLTCELAGRRHVCLRSTTRWREPDCPLPLDSALDGRARPCDGHDQRLPKVWLRFFVNFSSVMIHISFSSDGRD